MRIALKFPPRGVFLAEIIDEDDDDDDDDVGLRCALGTCARGNAEDEMETCEKPGKAPQEHVGRLRVFGRSEMT